MTSGKITLFSQYVYANNTTTYFTQYTFPMYNNVGPFNIKTFFWVSLYKSKLPTISF